MSGITAALIWRPLRRDLGRTALSLVAVALGVGVVLGIRVANRAAVADFQQHADSLAAGADLLVTGPVAITPAALDRLNRIGAVAEATPYLDRRLYDPAHDDTLEVVGVDLVANGINLSGQGTVAYLPDGIAIPSDYALRHDLHPGDQLRLVSGGAIRSLTVVAILPAGAGSPIAVMDLAAALPTLGISPAAFDGLRVEVAPGTSIPTVRAALAPLVPAPDQVITPQAQVAQKDKMLNAFRANLQALAYVSLLVGIFLIYNTVSISVVRRRSAIATLRALGASRAAITGSFLTEGLAVGLAGGLLGLAVGRGLAASALVLVQRTVNALYAATSGSGAAGLTHLDIGWGLLLGAGAGVLAAWAPARQAAAVPPAAALRPGGAEAIVRFRARRFWGLAAVLALAAVLFARLPEPGNLPVWGFASALAAVLACAALTPPLLTGILPRLRARWLRAGRIESGMAAGGLAGALRRSAVLTAAIAIAVGVMLGVAVMVGSFRQTVAVWIGQQLQADVFVRAADWDRNHPVPLAPDLVALIAATPGAAGAEASHTQPWSFDGQPVLLNTHWRYAGAKDAGAQYRYVTGGGASSAAIVSEPFYRRFHIAPGAQLDLDGASIPVSGVFYDYTSDRGEIVLPRVVFTRAFGEPDITEMGLIAAPGVAPSELARRLNRRLAQAGVATGVVVNDNAALRGEAMRVFDQTFRITYALELITLLVAILGVANTLLAVILEREREFALLRYLGASRALIRRMVLAEAAVLGALGIGLGWLIAGALAWILVRVINVQSFGWTIQFHPPWLFLATASLLVWLATLAAGVLPADAARRRLRQTAPAAVAAE